jgi:hypothetical protein
LQEDRIAILDEIQQEIQKNTTIYHFYTIDVDGKPDA